MLTNEVSALGMKRILDACAKAGLAAIGKP